MDEIKNTLKMKDSESKFLVRTVPIMNELMKCMVEEGTMTDKIRKWAVAEFIEVNLNVISTFELYL